MNVLADIVSTFNDHSAENFTPSHVPRTNKILSIFPEWIKKKILKYFLLAVVIVIAVIILRACAQRAAVAVY